MKITFRVYAVNENTGQCFPIYCRGAAVKIDRNPHSATRDCLLDDGRAKAIKAFHRAGRTFGNGIDVVRGSLTALNAKKLPPLAAVKLVEDQARSDAIRPPIKPKARPGFFKRAATVAARFAQRFAARRNCET